MTSIVPPTKNVALTIEFPVFDTAGKLKTGAAFTSTQVSLDHGSFAPASNAPSELATSSGVYTLALIQAEMNADVIMAKMVVSTAGCQDVLVIIHTTARKIDDLAFPATSGRSMVVDANGLVDANAVKVGPTGAGTAQTAIDLGAQVDVKTSTRSAPGAQMDLVNVPNATALNAVADAFLKRDWTAVSGEAARSVLNALRKLRNKVSFNGVNTLTIYKEDDATPAYTQTVVEDAAQTPFKSVG